ncbi:MAG: hypothetical protein GC154_14285 [bacterium]|nr:hypothetical protein [bacterium]
MKYKKIGFLALAFALASLPVFAQGAGVFNKTADWDLGDGTKVAGSASEAGGVYTLKGNGADIWGNADEGFYLYTEKPIGESWRVSGLVEWIDHGTNDWAKIGPMIRANGASGSSGHMVNALRGLNDLVSPQYRERSTARSHDGRGRLPSDPATEVAGPVYLRIGYWAPLDVIYAEFSKDGTTWNFCATAQVAGMKSNANYAIGFAVTNHENNTALATGKVSNVKLEQVTTAPSFLSLASAGVFTNQLDLGGFTRPGSGAFASGTYTVTGGGGDIWEASDRMHYLYKKMTGSFEATADLFVTAPGEPTWTKGGLMVRSSLSSGAANGFCMVRSDNGHQLQSRDSQAVNSAGSGIIAYSETNGMFKIRKVGPLVESYYQNLSGAWVKHGSVFLKDIGSEYLFGIACTSHDNSLLGTVEVSQLQITEYPFEVVRALPVSEYAPGQTFNVDLNVNVRTGQTISSLVIKEAVPPQATSVTGITGGGTLANGVITWNLSNVTGSQKLSYTVTATSDINVAALNWGTSNAVGGNLDLPVGGPATLSAITFNVAETFSYPSNNSNELAGKTLEGRNGGFNWNGAAWTKSGALTNAVLDTATLDAGLVESQPTEYNPGNYSVKLTGDNTDGIARTLPVNPIGGEVWVSFTYKEGGPAANHWSGITFYNKAGQEVSFIGKPYNAAKLGIGNLTNADALTNADYTVAHHILARIQINGANSQVSMWVDPDKTDRWDTADAKGADNISDVASFRFRRGGATGNAYFDNLWISSVPAIPPAGAGRVNLRIDDPNRPATLPAWDVISIDQVDDAVTGVPGFGHDNGNNYYLIVTGNIYFTDVANLSGQVVAYGLPVDHMSGLNGHILGPYNNTSLELGLKNSIKFMNNAQQMGPFTFDMVPPGKYKELRSAQTVGNGDGELDATFKYDDGTTEIGTFHADDWFNDGGEIQFANTRQLVNGMDRLEGGASTYAQSRDPAIFECITPVNPNKTLVSVTLQLNTKYSTNPGYNLYDIWGVPAGGGTPVTDWSLF